MGGGLNTGRATFRAKTATMEPFPVGVERVLYGVVMDGYLVAARQLGRMVPGVALHRK